MKLVFFILFVSMSISAATQDFSKAIGLVNKNWVSSSEYELNEGFSTSIYNFFIDTSSNQRKLVFIMEWSSDCGSISYGKGICEVKGNRYFLKYDKELKDTIIYLHDSTLSEDSLYIYYYNNYGNYASEPPLGIMLYLYQKDSLNNNLDMHSANLCGLPIKYSQNPQGTETTFVMYYSVSKKIIKNKKIKIENEIELNLSDTINSVNIVGHIRNLSVHKSNRGEILEIKDGKLVKIIPYENKE